MIGRIPLYLLALCLALCSSCGPAKEFGTARVHQCWEARFTYDYGNRRLVSTHDSRMRGRSWGRDERGRVDFDRYWTGRPIPSQDLLPAYRENMDVQRLARWRAAEKERLRMRAEQMEQEATGGDARKTEEKTGENEDNSLPVPFLPEGIDFPGETPDDDGGLPFAPLPEAPVLPEAPSLPDPGLDSGLPPLDENPDPLGEPPPFDPLPPL